MDLTVRLAAGTSGLSGARAGRFRHHGGMDISTRLDFAATPDDVYAMLTDQTYLEEVCDASQALSYAASVSGSTTSTSRTLAAPESAAKFTGSQLTVTEQVVWGAAAPDGSRSGSLTMSVAGQPVSMKGTLALGPGGRGTVVDLSGDLKVAIPLLGKKLEASAAPAVMAGFKTQQKVGDRWLAG